MESRALGFIVLILLRAMAWIYFIQPIRLRRLWGRSLGALLRRFKLRSKVVEQNLAFAFASDEGRREVLFRQAYEHLGHLVFEVLLLLGPMRRYVTRFSELHGVEHWKDAKSKGKGVIFLASHVGNWEVMAATGAIHGGMELMLVTKHLKPEWLHQAIQAGREKCGVSATYEPRTLKDVLASLKKNRTVGIVLDQYAGPPIGVRVPVFGVPVGTSTAIAALARRTGAAILPVVNYRTADGRWRVEIRPALVWRTANGSAGGPADDSGDAVKAADCATLELAENTALYSSVLERDIQGHPEQWLWIHRRFKGDLSPLREGEWREGRARR